jgi:hypothetical protein
MALIAGRRKANKIPMIEMVKTTSTRVKDFFFFSLTLAGLPLDSLTR